jgi:glycerate 2-kinase
LDRSQASQLIGPDPILRTHLSAIVRAAIDAADAGFLVQQSITRPEIVAALHRAMAVDVIAIGKAAAPMAAAFAAFAPAAARMRLTVGVGDAGHPVPDERSVETATQALDVAAAMGEHDLLVVLLSGGASALAARAISGITFADKQQTVRLLLGAGADIAELNTVRKHLSAIKGGRLAAANAGATMTLAVSDVVGDDLSVIGSGPTVPDPSTWHDALAVIERRGGRATYPRGVIALLERGVAGALPDTPKPADPRLSRSHAMVIGGRQTALAGARGAARALGYDVHIVDEPIIGEARCAGRARAAALAHLPRFERPTCILSAGETTVTVKGNGRGGRNQELALGMVRTLAESPRRVAAASVGTDGIDGPTDAAGAFVDTTTLARAQAANLDPDRYLNDNNSYEFFRPLNDLIRLGPTNTNVGDIQVLLIKE